MLDQREIVSRHVDCVLGREMSFPVDYCVSFVAALVKEIHGVDILGNRFRGWDDEDAARDEFPLGLAITLSRRLKELGWERVAPYDAPFGAVAVVRPVSGAGHCCGIHLTNGWIMVRHAKGVRYTRDGVVAIFRPIPV